MRKIRLEAMNLGRRKLALLLFALMGGIAASAVPLSGHYTINQVLPTSGTNFNSFNDAVFALDQGVNGPVVFDVVKGSGPYSDQITIYEVPGASATNTITFNGHGEMFQFLSTSELMKAGIKLDGASHIIFDSLVVKCLASDNELEYGYGFELIRNSDHNIIRNCTVLNLEKTLTPQRTAGIVIHGFEIVGAPQGESLCDDNLITKNTIIGGWEGIVLDAFSNSSGADTIFVENNKLTYNTIKSAQSVGIVLLWTNNTLVEGNDISGTFYDNASFGIWIIEANYNTIVRGNRIHDFLHSSESLNFNTRKAIDFGNVPAPAGKENIIANNIIYNFDSPEEITGISASSNTNGLLVYHNTISLDAASNNTNTVKGFYVESAQNTRLKFNDNIVTIGGNGTGEKYAIYVEAVLKDFVSDNNNVYTNTDNAFIGRYAGGTYSNFQTWNAATSLDFHSISINPSYADLAIGNLKPTSALIDNYGKYVGIDKDILDSTRPNTYPDMGAYEFLSKPCSTPPVAGATISSPVASGCLATPLIVSLSGNSAGKGQTYQWQISETENGEYKDTGILNIIPPIDITLNKTLYYRCEVTCEGAATYSTPLLVKANGAMPAGTFTINKNKTSDGTNFTSFNEALALLKCGVGGPIVFNVEAGSGPYNEQLVIPAIVGTSAENTVTFNGNSETLAYTATSSLERAVIKLNGADYFTFDNLKIAANGASGAFGYGVHLLNNADHNTVSNCTITMTNLFGGDDNYAGIVVNASPNKVINTSAETNLCDSNSFIGNTISGGVYGISIASAVAPNNVSGYKIINNKITDFMKYGIYITGTAGTVIESNDISRPTRIHPAPGTTRENLGTFFGIYAKGKSTAMVISKNKLHDAATMSPNAFAAHGIYLDDCDGGSGKENIVSNNLVYGFTLTGSVSGIYNKGSDSAWFSHNTIVLDDPSFTGSSNSSGFYQTGTAKGIKFNDNNVKVARGNTSNVYGIYMSDKNTTFETANNNYYVVSATGINNIGFFDGTSYVTLADWKTATGKEASSLSVDPAFVAGSYIPTASALDNKGTFVQITTDIDGVTRSATTPDIGAYEFDGILPVNLVSITAAKSASNAIISFTTASEYDSKEFVIERSTDGVTFIGVGTLAAKGSSDYSFTDANAFGQTNGNAIYYRLKIVDKNGAYKYSVIVRLAIVSNLGTISLFPNPFTTELFATVAANRASIATISVKNVTGATVANQSIRLAQGSNVVKINHVSQLPKGVYMVTIQTAEGMESFKVVK